jgi:predicted amidohydrolase
MTAVRHSGLVPGRMTEVLGDAARRHRVWIATGFIERDATLDGVLYNSAALIGPDGRIVGVQRKCHISPTETDYFRPGPAIHTYPTELGVIGLSICYDFWFPEYVRRQVLAGCELHVCCTNNQPAFILGNVEMAVVRAVENQIFVAACNRVGRDDETGYGYLGRSRLVAPDGTILAQGGDNDEVILTGTVDRKELLRWRGFIGLHKDRRADLFDN